MALVDFAFVSAPQRTARHADAHVCLTTSSTRYFNPWRWGECCQSSGKSVLTERESYSLLGGDIDVDGVLILPRYLAPVSCPGILSRLRNFFPQVGSIMMDHETLFSRESETVSGNETTPPIVTDRITFDAGIVCVMANGAL